MEEAELYQLALDKGALGSRRDLLRVGFGAPAENTQLVVAVGEQLRRLDAAGSLTGELLCLDGPMSLPIAFTLGHMVAHRYGAIAVFDPKLGGYVVAITHHPSLPLGMLLPKENRQP